MPPGVCGLKRPQFKGFHLRICLKSCGTDLEDFLWEVAKQGCHNFLQHPRFVYLKNKLEIDKISKIDLKFSSFLPISCSFSRNRNHLVQNRENIHEETGLETLRDEEYYPSPLSPAQLSWWREEKKKSSRSVHLILKMYFIFLNGVNEGN